MGTVSAATQDGNTANNTTTRDVNVTAGTDASVSISQAPGGALLIGDNATFTINPRYSGDVPQNLVLSASIHPNLTITNPASFNQNGWSCAVAVQAVTCNRASGGAGAGHNVAIGNVTVNVTAHSAGAGLASSVALTTTTPDVNPANNNASANTTIQPPAVDLRANKTGPNPPLAVVGVPFNFSVSMSNIGNAPLVGTARLIDTLPPGLTVQSYTLNGWSCVPAAPVVGPEDIICQRSYTAGAPLNPGATSPAVVMVTEATAEGVYVNNARAESPDATHPDTNPGNDATSVTVTAQVGPDSADLRVIKSAGPDPVPAGEVLTYTIEVVNDGPSPATSVTLTDTLGTLFALESPGFLSASATGGGSCNPSGATNGGSVNLSCGFPTVPVCTAGADCPVVTVQIRPGGNGGVRTNTATAISSAVADPNLANNTGSASSTIEARADMRVSATVSPNPVLAATNLTYVFTARNRGPSTASAASITVTLPEDVTFVSATPSAGSCSVTPGAGNTTTAGNRTLTCGLNNLGSNVNRTLTVVVRPNLGLQGATITASAQVSTTTTELDYTNNGTSIDAQVQDPQVDLLINKSDDPDPVGLDNNVTYTIRATNLGPSWATNVTVTDDLPPTGFEFVSATPQSGSCTTVPLAGSIGGQLVCNLGTVAPSANATLEVVLRAVAKGVHTNSASVTSQEAINGFPDPNPANNAVTEPTTVRTRSDMTVASKVPSADPVGLMEPFYYFISIRNNGPHEADGVIVSDTLPAGMELASAIAPLSTAGGSFERHACTGSAGDTAFTCDLGTASADAWGELSVPVRVVSYPAGGVITNTASVNTTLSIDLNNTNNSASGPVTVQRASLGGTVYVDANNNGVMDGGETGLAGVTVTLNGTAFLTAVNRTVVTDPSGAFLFEDLPAGTYTLTETQPANYLDATNSAGSEGGSVAGDVISNIVLGRGTAATGYLFGELPASNISGLVYHDVNANGAYDAEPGIDGVTLTLTGTDDRGDSVNLTQLSAGGGLFDFQGLRPGSYTLTQTQPAGYEPGTTSAGTVTGAGSVAGTVAAPLDNVISNIVLGVGGTSVDNRFGEVQYSSISGRVFWDQNGNDAWDAGEPLLAGVSIRLTGTDNVGDPVDRTEITDAAGSYVFTNVPPSDGAVGYTLTQTQPAGYVTGPAIPGSTGGVAGADGNHISGIIFLGGMTNSVDNDFAEIAAASLAGQVYLDLDRNGAADPGEPPLAGVTIDLTGTDDRGDPVSLSASTGADGRFLFDELRPGTYTLTQTQPSLYADGAHAAGSHGGDVSVANRISAIVLAADADGVNYLFGEWAGALGGVVFEDTNRNGQRDGGEPGIGGVTVTLAGNDLAGNPVNRTTQTLADGSYRFGELPASSPAGYAIIETQPTDFLDGDEQLGSLGGTIAGNDHFQVVLAPGAVGGGYNFGEIRQLTASVISGAVYLDDNRNGSQEPGEPGLAGVTVELSGTDDLGQPVNRTTVTDADGLFRFDGLPPGSYTLTETQPRLYADGGAVAGSAGGNTSQVNVISDIALGETVSADGYLFAEWPGELSGWVHDDPNLNGLRDPGEAGIPGVTVTLSGQDLDGAPVNRSTQTGVDGHYRFGLLPASSPAGYTLVETQPADYLDGAEQLGSLGGEIPANDQFRVVLSAGARGSDYNFAEILSAVSSLCGRVWLDGNHDRHDNEPPEAGLEGWIVELYLPGADGAQVATTSTRVNGEYCFEDLLPGRYQVRFVHPGTRVVYGGIDDILLPPGDTVLDQSLPVDPSGRVYDSVTREPVAGATVTLEGPAGFDPALHLLGGAGNVAQVTGADGFYQFLLNPGAPAGSYTLVLQSPPGYLPAPSGLIPACAGSLNVGAVPDPLLIQTSNAPPVPSAPAHDPAACAADSGGVAAGADSTQYYFSFQMTPALGADVLNNHLPVDPVASAGGAITAVKTSAKVNVSRGDLVPYRLSFTNTLPVTLTNITLRDQMPAGFAYRRNSARLDGVAAEPTLDGPELSWTGVTLAPNQSVSADLLLVVGAGVGDGEYINRTWAQDGALGAALSNVASATVRVVPDPTLDCADVIGKVFDDRNANGYQDEGEPGVPNVRLATVNGLLVTTDAEGRFHVACADVPNALRGSNFIMKLDERSLPSGYRVTTENPRVVRLTRGKLGRLNFGVSVHRVVRVELTGEAFADGADTPLAPLAAALDRLLEPLKERPAIVRLAYGYRGEDPALVDARLRAVREYLRQRWGEADCCYTLLFEEERFDLGAAGKGDAQ